MSLRATKFYYYCRWVYCRLKQSVLSFIDFIATAHGSPAPLTPYFIAYPTCFVPYRLAVSIWTTPLFDLHALNCNLVKVYMDCCFSSPCGIAKCFVYIHLPIHLEPLCPEMISVSKRKANILIDIPILWLSWGMHKCEWARSSVFLFVCLYFKNVEQM